MICKEEHRQRKIYIKKMYIRKAKTYIGTNVHWEKYTKKEIYKRRNVCRKR